MIHGITIELEQIISDSAIAGIAVVGDAIVGNRGTVTRNALNEEIKRVRFIQVDNVIVGQPTESEILDSTDLTGRKAVYVLGIPKGDRHNWTDKHVRFFGREFKTIGAPIEGIEDMIPLKWNKKVRCEIVDPS